MVAAGMSAFAAESEPIITFRSIVAHETNAKSYSISIGTTQTTYIDVDEGFGKVEYEVTPAVFNPETGAVKSTVITLTPTSSGVVKIYGDASLVDFFDAEGAYLESLDLKDCTNLDVLNLSHNRLKSLDLSKYTKLSAIYLTDNPFTPESPLVIGKNHPNLSILEVDIVDHMEPDFDITTFPELMVFDAYANRSITHIDPTKCPKLVRLSLDLCAVSTLDVSKNPDLLVLNIEDTRITEIDLSNNPNLMQFYARNESGTVNVGYHLSKVDISKNPLLTICTLGGNDLEELDLSQNKYMQHLNVAGNRLKDIDVSMCPDLYYLNITNNDMGFKQLPLPLPNWIEYYYEQRPLVTERSYAEGSTIDFSDLVLREGTTTGAVLCAYDARNNAVTELDNSYYTYSNGKIQLLKAHSDSLYVAFSNTSFPDANLVSQHFMVKTAENYGKPTAMVTFTTSLAAGKPVELSLGLAGATAATPRTVKVDFGDGVLVDYAITTEALGEANVKGVKAGYGAVTVYTPEGETLTAFGADGIPMYSVDFTAASGLRELMARGAGLTTVDLGMNNALRSLDMSNNNFTAFSLEGTTGVLGKSFLQDINLSNNKLTEVTLNDTRAIRNLNLSHNNFSEFSYKEFEYIKSFDISHNNLTDVNIVYMSAAEKVDLSYNSLTELTLPETNVFKSFNISHNKFSMKSVPATTGLAGYVYAPQAQVVIPTKAPGADLSAQDRVDNGVATKYTWKKEDGTVLTDAQVNITDGKARFLDDKVGKIYCEITNASLPDFAGENVLRTTLVEAAAMPTNLIAEFTTPEASNVELSLTAAKNGTALYIDWSGEGYDLEQYQLGETYTLFHATTRAGATAKVYTYDPSEKITVFSISDAKMSYMDASKLTDLICLGVNNAGLSDIKLPETTGLMELYLDGNELDNIDLSVYPNLMALTLNSNNLTTLDLSPCKNLGIVAAVNNKIENLVLDNPMLWGLDVSTNNLSEIDLSRVPDMQQLILSHNNISDIDVSNLRLMVLHIDHNRMSFATLPVLKNAVYEYADQARLDIECIDGKVDLSAQAMVADIPTVFRWYIGTPYLNVSTNMYEGEELFIDKEYTLADGVTTFIDSFNRVSCLMTNAKLDKLTLLTNEVKVVSGIEDIEAENGMFSVTVIGDDIHVAADVADGTPVGLVALDGRTIAQAVMRDGKAVLNGAKGTFVIAVGNRAAKVAVR